MKRLLNIKILPSFVLMLFFIVFSLVISVAKAKIDDIMFFVLFILLSMLSFYWLKLIFKKNKLFFKITIIAFWSLAILVIVFGLNVSTSVKSEGGLLKAPKYDEVDATFLATVIFAIFIWIAYILYLVTYAILFSEKFRECILTFKNVLLKALMYYLMLAITAILLCFNVYVSKLESLAGHSVLSLLVVFLIYFGISFLFFKVNFKYDIAA